MKYKLESRLLGEILTVHGVAKSQTHWVTSLSLFTFMHWRRKWQPTPVSCLENPRDGGAWWAAVCGVAQSRTWLKRLSSSSRYADDTTVMVESQEELKGLLKMVKKESLKTGLKFKKLISWHLVPSLHGKQKGKTWKQCQIFIVLGSKICRQWQHPLNLKTLAPWKESYDKLRQHIKSRDITLPM